MRTRVMLPAVAALLLLVGSGCMKPSNPGTNTNTTPVPQAQQGTFGKPLTLSIGEAAKYDDGLRVTLQKIDDSRCPADVQCIWAGELAPTFRVSGGKVGTETVVMLGTTRTKEQKMSGYVFRLDSATERAAVLNVTLEENGTIGNTNGVKDDLSQIPQ